MGDCCRGCNYSYEVNELRLKLKYLTGCRTFGESDGMIGTCVDCFHDNQELWKRCTAFSGGFDQYKKVMCKDVEHKSERQPI